MAIWFGVRSGFVTSINGKNFDKGCSVLIVKDDDGHRYDIERIEYDSDTKLIVTFNGRIDEDVPAHVRVANYDGWSDTEMLDFIDEEKP